MRGEILPGACLAAAMALAAISMVEPARAGPARQSAAGSPAEGRPTPILAITPQQARTLFGGKAAKMILHYGPGRDPFPDGRSSPVFLLDFTRPQLEFEFVCDDARSGDGDPVISPDGTRMAYNDHGKIYVRRLAKDGPEKTYIADGFEPRWWFHPKTGDPYVIYTDHRSSLGDNVHGTTSMRKLKTGTCEPAEDAKVLLKDLALNGGRSPDGRYICSTLPGCLIVELTDPLAVENATAKVLWSTGRMCNGTISQDPKRSGIFLYEDPGHNRLIRSPGANHINDIPPPAAWRQMEWAEWSTHPDYLSVSPSKEDDWENPDKHSAWVYQFSTGQWTQVADHVRDTHLWVAQGKTPAAAKRGPAPKAGTAKPGAGIVKLAWPASREGLVLGLTGDPKTPVIAQKRDGQPFFQTFYDLTAKGISLLDRHRGLRLEGGYYVAEDIGEPLAAEFRDAPGLTLELYFTPTDPEPQGEIVWFGSEKGDGHMSLRQAGKTLVWTLDFANGVKQEVVIAPKFGDRVGGMPPMHLVLTADAKATAWYVDGKVLGTGAGLRGSLADWKAGPFTVGSDGAGKQPWRGHVEGLALYRRSLSAAEAAAEASAYLARVKARKAVTELRLLATLVKQSTIQKPGTLPYRRAYAIYLYKVEKVTAGKYSEPTLRVAHWMFLDNQMLALSEYEVGKTYDLTVEPLDDYPEFEGYAIFDTLDTPPEAPTFYDVGPLEPLKAAAPAGRS